MIYRATCTKKDKQLFSECKIASSKESKIESGIKIDKPWGNEIVAYNDDSCAIWDLYIKVGERTSFHCHPNKNTIIIITSGKVKCELANSFLILSKSDILIMEKGVFHSSEAISENGAKLAEINSPPLLADLIRLRDSYGREGMPYFPVNK